MVRNVGTNPQALALKTYLPLVAHATRRETTTYHNLAVRLNVMDIAVRNYLEPIYTYCRHNGLPALTTIVVSKERGEPTGGDERFGGRENMYKEREKVYQFDWYKILPPCLSDLT